MTSSHPAASIRALDPDERRVASARVRVRDLVCRLVATPINPAVYTELRAFLDEDAAAACASWERVRARGIEYHRRRLLRLLRLAGGAR